MPENNLPVHPQQLCTSPEEGSYQLTLKFQGTFVFVIKTDVQSDLINTIDVYAPACGHMYSAGLKGFWNDPNPDKPPQNPAETYLLMIEPRRHCLELHPQSTKRSLSLNDLRTKISGDNLWPQTKRAVAIGWDLVISIPVPDYWDTSSIDVNDSFSGTDSGLFAKMGMDQTLTYCGVYSFKLKGSPLPIAQPGCGCTFIINAEPACIPSMEHQRRAAEALAQVVGLDLRLEKSLRGTEMHKLPDGRTGSCMGGAIMESLGE